MLTLSDWQQTFKLLHDKAWNEYHWWRGEPSSVAQVRGLNILLREGLMMDPSRDSINCTRIAPEKLSPRIRELKTTTSGVYGVFPRHI